MHLERFGLGACLHLKAFPFALGLELHVLLVDLPLSLFELESLPVQCLLGGGFCLLEFGFSFKAFLGGCSLPFHLSFYL